jgi:hypothetical protein
VLDLVERELPPEQGKEPVLEGIAEDLAEIPDRVSSTARSTLYAHDRNPAQQYCSLIPWVHPRIQL